MRLIICMLLMVITNLKAEELIKINYKVSDKACVFIVINTSKNNLLIKNLKNSVMNSFADDENPFIRNKVWTFLRSKNTGFGSNGISLFFDLDRKFKKEINYTTELEVATYNPNKNEIGDWRKIKVIMRPSPILDIAQPKSP